MDSIVGLGNRITYNFVAPGATKSYTTLDSIVNLGNRITYEIVYDFRRDRTTVELCSWKMYGETNLMITYDVTCRKLSRQLGNSHAKLIMDFPRKVLVCNSPLSHQILLDIRSFCICQTPIETNDFPNTTY